MSTSLTKAEPRPGMLASRPSDARTDAFVVKEMARGELVVRATSYTQSGASCALQLGAAAVPLGVMGTAVMGTLLGGLAFSGVAMAMLGAVMLLETSNRVVVTENALVVQNSVLLKRYELDRIEEPRIEVLGPRKWISLDVRLLDPRYFIKAGPGLRFRYRVSDEKTAEVFVGFADAAEYLTLIQRPGQLPR